MGVCYVRGGFVCERKFVCVCLFACVFITLNVF